MAALFRRAGGGEDAPPAPAAAEGAEATPGGAATPWTPREEAPPAAAGDGAACSEKLEKKVAHLQQQNMVWSEKNRRNKERIFSLENQLQLSDEKYQKLQPRMHELQQRLQHAEERLAAAQSSAAADAVQHGERAARAELRTEALEAAAELEREFGGFGGAVASELRRAAEELRAQLQAAEAAAAEARAACEAAAAAAADAEAGRAASAARAAKAEAEAREQCAASEELQREAAIEQKKNSAKLRDLQTAVAHERQLVAQLQADLHDARAERDCARGELIQEKRGKEKGKATVTTPRQGSVPVLHRGGAADGAGAAGGGGAEQRLLAVQQERNSAVDEAEALRHEAAVLRQDNDRKAKIIQELMAGGARRSAAERARRLSAADCSAEPPAPAAAAGSKGHKPGEDLDRQIRASMQSVVEETLLRNMALQTNLEALTAELQREKDRNRALLRRQRERDGEPVGPRGGSDDSITTALTASSVFTPQRCGQPPDYLSLAASPSAAYKPPPKMSGRAVASAVGSPASAGGPATPAATPRSGAEPGPPPDPGEELVRITRNPGDTKIGLRFDPQGRVTYVDEAAPAGAAGIQVGMQIIGVAGRRLRPEALHQAFRDAPPSFFVRVVPAG